MEGTGEEISGGESVERAATYRFYAPIDSIIPINPNFVPGDIQIRAVSIQLSQICYPWKMQENDLPVVRTSAIELDQ